VSIGILKSNIKNVNGRIVNLMKLINYIPLKGKVVIKPNIVAAVPPERGVTTHPLAVEALIKYLKEFGCEIVIAESSSVAQNTDRVFEVSGYSDLAKKYNIDILNLEKAEKVKISWKYGEILIPKIMYDYEYINFAKMKTHIGTTVTLGIKNQKGLLNNAEKKKFHIKYDLHEAIFELSKVIKPDLTILDGIIALEGDGPGGAGNPINLNVLVAGKNLYEVDNVALKIMGFESGEVGHIPIVNEINCVGDDISEVRYKFKRAKKDKLELKNIKYFSFKSCSGCNERVAIGLKRFRRAEDLHLNIIAGKEPRFIKSDNPIVCFGDCCKEFAEKNSLFHVKGCPPDMNSISYIYDEFKE
jgi:uncharacterized protein (DUF362 family)